jgi:hypothetical protein
MPAVASASGQLHSEFVRLYFYKLIGKLTIVFPLQEFNFRIQTVDFFYYLHVVFVSQMKSK